MRISPSILSWTLLIDEIHVANFCLYKIVEKVIHPLRFTMSMWHFHVVFARLWRLSNQEAYHTKEQWDLSWEGDYQQIRINISFRYRYRSWEQYILQKQRTRVSCKNMAKFQPEIWLEEEYLYQVMVAIPVTLYLSVEHLSQTNSFMRSL